MKALLKDVKRVVCEICTIAFWLLWAGVQPLVALAEGALAVIDIYICMYLVAYIRGIEG